jgi:ribosome-binding protein aMBF1 (putative translation factor)
MASPDNPGYADICAVIRRTRLAVGWSQWKLAEAMTEQGFGWYQSTVNRTETGGRELTWREAIALSEMLGFDLREVLGV